MAMTTEVVREGDQLTLGEAAEAEDYRFKDYSDAEVVRAELEVLGLDASRHIVSFFEPFIVTKQTTINALHYYVRSNVAGSGRCRVAIYDAADPTRGDLRPARKLWGETNTSGCGATCTAGNCSGGDGSDVDVGSGCCTPTDISGGSGADNVCAYTRGVSPAVQVYPNMLYWIGMQCSVFGTNAATFRTLSTDASWSVVGYLEATDSGGNHYEIGNQSYGSAWPNDIIGTVTLTLNPKGGGMPYLQVWLNG